MCRKGEKEKRGGGEEGGKGEVEMGRRGEKPESQCSALIFFFVSPFSPLPPVPASDTPAEEISKALQREYPSSL